MPHSLARSTERLRARVVMAAKPNVEVGRSTERLPAKVGMAAKPNVLFACFSGTPDLAFPDGVIPKTAQLELVMPVDELDDQVAVLKPHPSFVKKAKNEAKKEEMEERPRR